MLKPAAALGRLGPRLPTIESRTVLPPAKVADPLYGSAEHRVWRDQVIERAGGRCEALTANGVRCTRSRPRHRMFADHKAEVRDGGPKFDVRNGQCLCGAHHSAKTAQARAHRRSN